MESPFTSRLDSYYVPTDSESLEIRNLLELPTSRLEALSMTTQLQELEEQSTHISNEQSELRLFISKHRALISLIRKLPIDILQEIFIACLPTHHNHLMSRWEPPILLTQICSFWRNVAHATPQLWKSIHIPGPYNKSKGNCSEYASYSSTMVDAVVEWLSRSAACPLDISLGHCGVKNSTLDGFYYKIIDFFIPFSERWREIRLSAPYQALVPIASLPLSKVPLLEALSLNCPTCYDYPVHTIHSIQLDTQWITSGVLKAPNLRDIGLSLTYLNWDVTRLPVNWSQLTNISLEGSSFGSPSPLSIECAYKLLSLCRNLITCRLEIGNLKDYDEQYSFEGAALISLPFLTKLSVREEATSLSRLFSLLHLPSLKYIEFRTAILPTEQSSTSLLSLLTRFQNTIKLVTDVRFYTRQDFINCLRLRPLLKSLHIRRSFAFLMDSPPGVPSCKIDDEFIKLFFEPSSDEGCLCPQLEDFEITSEGGFSETILLQFVKEKKNGDSSTTTTGLAKLKYLYVAFDDDSLSDSSIKQELEPYEQAGLVVSLS
jgi:F-box-like